MQQIEITGEVLPIVKSSIVLKEKPNYLKRHKGFERKHKMKSVELSKEFAAGKLGDDAEWFDWLFVCEAYNKIIQQNNRLWCQNLE